MYTFALVIQTISGLALVGLVAVVLVPALRKRREDSARDDRKRSVASVASFTHSEEVTLDPRAAAEANLRFLGLPRVRAGTVILNVPTLDPGQEDGWDKRRTVLTFARVVAQLRQGSVPTDIVELGGGYSLVATSAKAYLLHAHNLTTGEESYLERQRQDAVGRGDGVIEDFEGVQWKIGTACGEHQVGGRRGEKSQSTIQVLSAHPDLGKNGMISCLPPDLLDSREHSYYDMRARSMDGGRVLFFFYAGGKWSCFMGRELSSIERDSLTAI